jgi:hypothetical protein
MPQQALTLTVACLREMKAPYEQWVRENLQDHNKLRQRDEEKRNQQEPTDNQPDVLHINTSFHS